MWCGIQASEHSLSYRFPRSRVHHKSSPLSRNWWSTCLNPYKCCTRGSSGARRVLPSLLIFLELRMHLDPFGLLPVNDAVSINCLEFIVSISRRSISQPYHHYIAAITSNRKTSKNHVDIETYRWPFTKYWVGLNNENSPVLVLSLIRETIETTELPKRVRYHCRTLLLGVWESVIR